MEKYRELEQRNIHLAGFGWIEIKESLTGEWQIDLFPRGAENFRDKIQIETSFSHSGDKYFECPKQNKGVIDNIYQ